MKLNLSFNYWTLESEKSFCLRFRNFWPVHTRLDWARLCACKPFHWFRISGCWFYLISLNLQAQIEVQLARISKWLCIVRSGYELHPANSSANSVVVCAKINSPKRFDADLPNAFQWLGSELRRSTHWTSLGCNCCIEPHRQSKAAIRAEWPIKPINF